MLPKISVSDMVASAHEMWLIFAMSDLRAHKRSSIYPANYASVKGYRYDSTWSSAYDVDPKFVLAYAFTPTAGTLEAQSLPPDSWSSG